MKRIHIALLLVLALLLCGCGKQEAVTSETTTPSVAAVIPLSLTDWSFATSTWSSPNGATIHITATPNRYTEGQSAAFVVRLEGEEAANTPCDWDGTQYTASVDLNAADGYCYYMVLTDTNGTVTEVSVNTPTDPRDETLINLEDSLNSYCALVVGQSTIENSQLLLTGGDVQVQAPKITNDGQTITCTTTLLELTLDGQSIGQQELALESTDDRGFYQLTLTTVAFDLPEMEADQQLQLSLNVTLSNGQTLTAPGGIWYYNDTALMNAVG